MPARIRLQRHGKKGQPYYHIVIADGRAPRDGKFIESIGTYNPLTIPAEIQIDFDKAISWLRKGATPSDTAKAILMYKGVLYKNHLLKGVAKGAMTEEMAEAKFQAWLQEKQAKVENKKNKHLLGKKDEVKKRLEAEAKVNLAKSEAIAKKRAKLLEKEHEAAGIIVAQDENAEPPAENPAETEPQAE
ncbi:MAG TPA: 30S ribosomal protein S16 [Bacteroidales bacterium]|nr:30S ribosomal protein S16 [Bacteroidales bacterium]